MGGLPEPVESGVGCAGGSPKNLGGMSSKSSIISVESSGKNTWPCVSNMGFQKQNSGMDSCLTIVRTRLPRLRTTRGASVANCNYMGFLRSSTSGKTLAG